MTIDRKGAYLKEARRCIAPRVCFGLIIDTYDDSLRTSPSTIYSQWRSAGVCVSYRRRSGWTKPLYARIGTPDALREWMAGRALARTLNWVVTPLVSDSLILSEWFNYAQSNGLLWGLPGSDSGRGARLEGCTARVRVSQWTTGDRADSITYTDSGKRWRWVSATNWWPEGVDVGVDLHGVGGSDGILRRAAGDDPRGSVRSRAVATCAAFTDLSDWWRTIATCALGITPSASAHGILRSNLRGVKLCTHSDTDAHRLERRAATGGRASVWFVGRVSGQIGPDDVGRASTGGIPVRTIPGPIHHVDVRSMYAWLLRERTYPVRYLTSYRDVRPDQLIALAQEYGVIAAVRVRAAEGEYPVRRDDKLLYPIGEFNTVLTGPDLLALSLTGEILSCASVALYCTGKPFTGFANAILNARALADSSGNAQHAALCKLIGNSLAGRLAMRQGRWIRCPTMDEPTTWGERRSLHARTGRVVRVQYRAGFAWYRSEDEFPPGPYTAAFAYLCAYGRAHMRSLRSKCPPRSVLAQDTDGLWLTEEGYTALGRPTRTGDGTPGSVRLTGSGDSAIFLGPAHYCIDGDWTLSGYHAPQVDPDTLMVSHTARTPLFQQRPYEIPRYVMTENRSSPLPAVTESGRVQDDGWILAPHILAATDRGR